MSSLTLGSYSIRTITTRKKSDIWLIGEVTDELSKTKLPSKHKVLSNFFYYKLFTNQTVKGCCNSVAKQVLAIWEAAGIQTGKKQLVVNKIEIYLKTTKN